MTELERGEHLLKRKELYEWWHPETKAGVAQAAAMNRALGNVAENFSVTSFAADTAAKVGLTDRTIRQSIARAKKIDEKVRDRIRDNPEIAENLHRAWYVKPRRADDGRCRSQRAAADLLTNAPGSTDDDRPLPMVRAGVCAVVDRRQAATLLQQGQTPNATCYYRWLDKLSL